MELDVVIFGGGAAGLWLLDALVRRGSRAVLLEAASLGHGQTVAAQGIIHGGLKYTLQGFLTGAAAHIREMPLVWRECLAGRREPDLRGTRIRSEFCYLWRTDSVASRLGMIGARLGLRIAPQPLEPDLRPPVLSRCPGIVARLDEQVISVPSFIGVLAARHHDRILKVLPDGGAAFDLESPGTVREVRLSDVGAGRRLRLSPRHVVFAAGAGNADLRRRAGLDPRAMQRRPLHMVLLRGSLPYLNGHCVDGAKTRVTITSDTDSAGRTVWQVGGQIAEEGVRLEADALLARARAEIVSTIPGVELDGAEWGTYRVDRAEGATASGGRPDAPQILREGNILTVWPTKLALAPRLADEVVALLPSGLAPPHRRPLDPLPPDWPRPVVASPPWESCSNWTTLDPFADRGARAA